MMYLIFYVQLYMFPEPPSYIRKNTCFLCPIQLFPSYLDQIPKISKNNKGTQQKSIPNWGFYIGYA